MAENPKLEDMGSETPTSSSEAYEIEEMGNQKFSISDQTNSLQSTNIKSDSFTVDMERFSLSTEKDTSAYSRITLQRSLSRKGSHRSGEKKVNLVTGNERDMSVVATSSPRAALVGASTPMVVTVGATDHPISPQLHHQITIMTGNMSGTTTPTTITEGKLGGKRFSFRRSPPCWTIDPRRVLLFFATLSSMGTILLIYFTLRMGKLSTGDDNAMDW
ncbi:hypothetical protein F0562_014248 [Nyssa sinensis]|uniref:Uncharacterized protein n=1 Tax=Nyssa sinensis TaxID=561372 RepID=A0A5J4ZRD2_9ASTE|nr:hypothetical protein F0562_014248 [Nyssa sinensis]